MKTKEKILVGAKNFLIKHGQSGFTVRSIAAEAGVNQGLVHHYFGSKENLILELIDYVVEKPFEMVKDQVVGKSKSDLKELVMNYLFRNNELMSLLIEFIYLSQHSEIVKEKITKVMRVRREFFTDFLGIQDPDHKIIFNAGIFGIVFISRIDNTIDVGQGIKTLFEMFNLTY